MPGLRLPRYPRGNEAMWTPAVANIRTSNPVVVMPRAGLSNLHNSTSAIPASAGEARGFRRSCKSAWRGGYAPARQILENDALPGCALLIVCSAILQACPLALV